MYANDTIGDCTCAAAGHMIEIWTSQTAHPAVPTTEQVLAAFDKVSREVAALGSANEAILQGADSILSAAVESAAGARQIAAAAEQASAASRQASTASAEQARGAEDLAAAIEEIASLAEALKQQNA